MAELMLILDKYTVDNWLCDKEGFSYAFMQYSFLWQHAIGLDIELHRDLIEDAHQEWVETCDEWKTSRFMRGADHLSYTKTFAILLYCLSKRQFCGTIREYVLFRREPPEFNGSDELKEELRQDVLGAPDVVTALEFCVCVMNFYEKKRLDRVSEFRFRMTESSRHDLISAILRKEMTPQAIFIAFENLYARH